MKTIIIVLVFLNSLSLFAESTTFTREGSKREGYYALIKLFEVSPFIKLPTPKQKFQSMIIDTILLNIDPGDEEEKSALRSVIEPAFSQDMFVYVNDHYSPQIGWFPFEEIKELDKSFYGKLMNLLRDKIYDIGRDGFGTNEFYGVYDFYPHLVNYYFEEYGRDNINVNKLIDAYLSVSKDGNWEDARCAKMIRELIDKNQKASCHRGDTW